MSVSDLRGPRGWAMTSYGAENKDDIFSIAQLPYD
jgi:hypothetical protein